MQKSGVRILFSKWFQRLKPGTSRVALIPDRLVALALGLLLGAIIYFCLPIDPDRGVVWLAGGAGLAGLILALRATGGGATGLFLTCLALGFILADREVHRFEPAHDLALLNGTETVSGWIESVDRNSRGRTRIILRLDPRLDAPDIVRRVRIIASLGEAAPGDHVRVLAELSPPNAPVMPGAYNARYYAWFDGLVATGFALGQLERFETAGQTPAQRLAAFRWKIAEHIRSRLQGRSGALAAALLTGERSALMPHERSLLRDAGLGHILAISGLHMALIAGGVYFGARAILALFPAYARRYNAAIPAALIGCLAAAGYLALSGAAIPTQRAFVMALVAFGAIITGRRALSMRSLAIAMIGVILIQPHAVMSAGFHMSFAAVGALIAVAEFLRQRTAGTVPNLPRLPGGRYLAGLSLTSLVAGSATAGFSAFHFNRLAMFGLPANLAAMPIFSAVVMPAGALGLLLIPTGLDAPFFWVMGQGLDAVFWVSERVADRPSPLTPIASVPAFILFVYSAGFALLVVGRQALRISGGLVLGLALLAWSVWPSPLAFISEDGVLIARQDGEWRAAPHRGGRFPVRVFLESRGASAGETLARRCDLEGCVAQLDGVRVAWTEQPEALLEDCARNDLVLVSFRPPAWVARTCDAVLSTPQSRRVMGGIQIWSTPDGYRLETARGARRRWSQIGSRR